MGGSDTGNDEGRRTMTMPLEVAAQVMRDAMRETVKRHSPGTLCKAA